MMFKISPLTQKGFSTIEALLASTILVLIATALMGAYIYGSESTTLAGQRARAAFLAEEGLEASRNIRDASFSNLTNGTNGLATSGSQWIFSGTSDITNSFYTRQITTSTVDTRRKKMDIALTWQQNTQRSGTSSLESRLTDWRRNFASWASPTQQTSLDLAGGDNGNEIALFYASGVTYAVLVRDSGPNAELYVINVSNPASISIVGSVELGSNTNDVAVCGNYAVVASVSASQELQVIDLTTPASPSLTGTLDLSGGANALSVACNNTTVFLGRTASAQSEIYAISIATPAAPSLLSSLELGASADATKITLAQNNQYLYVASPVNSSELFIVSISNPSSISLTSSFDIAGGSNGTAVTAFSTYAVLGRADGNILIIDASTPSSPSLVSSTLDIGTNVQDLAMGVGDIYVFAASNTPSTPTKIIDVSIPSAPTLLGSVSMSGDTKGIVWDFDLNRGFTAGTTNTEELSVIQPN